MKIVFSKKCLEYSDWHIESPERVRKAYEILKSKGYEFIEPKPASEEDILKVHSKEHVERIKNGDFYDPDTPAYENIYEYARLAAGGAIKAAEENSFSLMRPPGHHAGKSGIALGASTLGFCYFNNIAIAVKYLDLPTLIIDIDGHHGNGTQEIFFKNPKVAYISLHRYPIYPGTGRFSEANCFNFPLPPYTGDEEYLKTLSKALSQVNIDDYELIGISAGFDCHKGDLASLDLTSNCFKEVGKMIKALGKPVFGVLEGGYIGENVGNDLHNLIQGLEGRNEY
ncbi:histone deacetylase [Candidatus Bathyarchaeota archaeon]|nr:histone deacetylase [Candidatus Bathyarchaeota archaeon]